MAQKISECAFRGLDGPAYSRDRAVCGFFVFDRFHEKMVGFMGENIEELEETTRVVFEATTKSRLIAGFREWESKLNKSAPRKRDYCE
jgi:hypothetical protein